MGLRGRRNLLKSLSATICLIVCGRAARRWDGEIRDKISLRCEVYRKMVSGQKELWSEYCRLRKEVKDLVRQKKISIWNEVIEKANADFEGSRKELSCVCVCVCLCVCLLPLYRQHPSFLR